MAAQVSSNRTCLICDVSEATHFCNCTGSPTLFCLDCCGRHAAKYPRSIHYSIPIVGLNHDPEEYRRKYEDLLKCTSELRRNVERIDQCNLEFFELIGRCIEYLGTYRTWWMQRMQAEKEALSFAIETAVQETANCLDQGVQPVSPLGKAIWTLQPEQLVLVSYSVNTPDLQTLCSSVISYANSLQALTEKFTPRPKAPEEPKEAPIEAKSLPSRWSCECGYAANQHSQQFCCVCGKRRTCLPAQVFPWACAICEFTWNFRPDVCSMCEQPRTVKELGAGSVLSSVSMPHSLSRLASSSQPADWDQMSKSQKRKWKKQNERCVD